MSLNLGSATKDMLNGKQYVELVSLSGLQVDLYNDYIGGEVRLGYLYSEAGEKTPITGISISGSLKAALNAISLSNKKTVKGAYEGPDFAILNGLTVI
jgi:predicted Zn-dependent protease